MARLLEDKPRLCSDCMRETGQQARAQAAGAEYSGGQCKRHFIAFARRAGESEDEIQRLVQTMSFCPDMSAPEAPPPKASFYPGAGPSSI